MPSTLKAPLAAENEPVSSDEARSTPAVDLLALERALNETAKPAFDTAAIGLRYPLLRNAFEST
jgi:hypothetical protein